jgi:hypothetical protein
VPAPHCPPRIAMLRELPVPEFRKHTFKNLHYILASMESEPIASEETLRLLLQKTIERNDSLVKMNHEATLAIPTILGAVWGILINSRDGTIAISIFALITIGILLSWRYFAHYIDDDVASNYSRIIFLEYQLKISKDCSIFNNLISGIICCMREKISSVEKSTLLTNVKELTKKQQFELIKRSTLDIEDIIFGIFFASFRLIFV